MDWYTQSFVACAPWSYVLMFGQTMLIAMLIERTLFLTLKARLNERAFMAQIRKLVVSGNRDRAEKLTQAAGNVPIARVCRAGLQALERGRERPAGAVSVRSVARASALPAGCATTPGAGATAGHAVLCVHQRQPLGELGG